ncbi:unnamed protein product [Phyllotreta striolata]|uniref:Caspase-3 n=1 Tax=Phyllotreta striolata TaxID=444603 RepID=A0A9N9TJ26_PHYSR|nr:unnamed protein product [Phyllotreta striolata]
MSTVESDVVRLPRTAQSPSPRTNPSESSNNADEGVQRMYQQVRALRATPTKKFVERQRYRTGRLEYPRDGGKDPGLVYIFNHENFDDYNVDSRDGSSWDVEELALCLQRLGYNITKENNVLSDLTSAQVRTKIKEIAESDLSQYNSLIIFVLTHGNKSNTLRTKDGEIYAIEFWNKIGENPTLADKPKMFVFQACKGDGYSTTGSEEIPKSLKSSSKIVPTETFSTNYLKPHTLTVYATIEGNVSFRDTRRGTWFIQELCKNFSAYGRRDDVLSLLIRTTKCVCWNYAKGNKKQMPFFVSTLRKKFYLNTNRDRDALMRIAESNEKILKNLEEIKKGLLAVLDERKK